MAKNWDDFIDDLGRWLRLSGVCKEPDEVKLDWLLEMATTKGETTSEKVDGAQRQFL